MFRSFQSKEFEENIHTSLHATIKIISMPHTGRYKG